MTAPKNARKSTAGREYVFDGRTYPSVTTVLKVLDKPILIPWATKFVATWAVDNVDIITRIAREDRDEAIKLAKKAADRRRDGAGAMGTAAHAQIESRIRGTERPEIPVGVDALEVGVRVAQWEDFWATTGPWEIVETEATVYNDAAGYAGSLDFIGKRIADGVPRVLDWKTGGKAIYDDTALQLVAYANGEYIGEGDKTRRPLPIDFDADPSPRAAAIHLRHDGWSMVPLQIHGGVFDVFLGLLAAWRGLQARKEWLEAPLFQGAATFAEMSSEDAFKKLGAA